jgi:hypothetical protein
VEDDLATREGIQERLVVGNVTVCEFEDSTAGGRRKLGDVTGATDQGADGVALFKEAVAESTA